MSTLSQQQIHQSYVSLNSGAFSRQPSSVSSGSAEQRASITKMLFECRVLRRRLCEAERDTWESLRTSNAVADDILDGLEQTWFGSVASQTSQLRKFASPRDFATKVTQAVMEKSNEETRRDLLGKLLETLFRLLSTSEMARFDATEKSLTRTPIGGGSPATLGPSGNLNASQLANQPSAISLPGGQMMNGEQPAATATTHPHLAALDARHQVVSTTAAVIQECEADGTKTINQFIILQPIASGSQGTVYLGIDALTNEFRAIKEVFRPNPGTSSIRAQLAASRIRQRLQREVDVMKLCIHPHLVTLYEVIDDPNDNAVYLVLKYIDNGPVLEILPDGTSNNGRCLPLHKVARFGRQLCSALTFLHEHGIVHRDVKLENVLLGNDDNVFLGDFGISEMLRKTAQSAPTDEEKLQADSMMMMTTAVTQQQQMASAGNFQSADWTTSAGPTNTTMGIASPSHQVGNADGGDGAGGNFNSAPSSSSSSCCATLSSLPMMTHPAAAGAPSSLVPLLSQQEQPGQMSVLSRHPKNPNRANNSSGSAILVASHDDEDDDTKQERQRQLLLQPQPLLSRAKSEEIRPRVINVCSNNVDGRMGSDLSLEQSLQSSQENISQVAAKISPRPNTAPKQLPPPSLLLRDGDNDNGTPRPLTTVASPTKSVARPHRASVVRVEDPPQQQGGEIEEEQQRGGGGGDRVRQRQHPATNSGLHSVGQFGAILNSESNAFGDLASPTLSTSCAQSGAAENNQHTPNDEQRRREQEEESAEIKSGSVNNDSCISNNNNININRKSFRENFEFSIRSAAASGAGQIEQQLANQSQPEDDHRNNRNNSNDDMTNNKNINIRSSNNNNHDSNRPLVGFVIPANGGDFGANEQVQRQAQKSPSSLSIDTTNAKSKERHQHLSAMNLSQTNNANVLPSPLPVVSATFGPFNVSQVYNPSMAVQALGTSGAFHQTNTASASSFGGGNQSASKWPLANHSRRGSKHEVPGVTVFPLRSRRDWVGNSNNNNNNNNSNNFYNSDDQYSGAVGLRSTNASFVQPRPVAPLPQPSYSPPTTESSPPPPPTAAPSSLPASSRGDLRSLRSFAEKGFGELGTRAFLSPEILNFDENLDQTSSARSRNSESPSEREMADEKRFTIFSRGDVWALGLTLYAMVYAKLPFDMSHGQQSFFDSVVSTEVEIPYPDRTPNGVRVPESLKRALRFMLDKNPERRATARQAKQLFRQLDYESEGWIDMNLPSRVSYRKAARMLREKHLSTLNPAALLARNESSYKPHNYNTSSPSSFYDHKNVAANKNQSTTMLLGSTLNNTQLSKSRRSNNENTTTTNANTNINVSDSDRLSPNVPNQYQESYDNQHRSPTASVTAVPSEQSHLLDRENEQTTTTTATAIDGVQSENIDHHGTADGSTTASSLGMRGTRSDAMQSGADPTMMVSCGGGGSNAAVHLLLASRSESHRHLHLLQRHHAMDSTGQDVSQQQLGEQQQDNTNSDDNTNNNNNNYYHVDRLGFPSIHIEEASPDEVLLRAATRNNSTLHNRNHSNNNNNPSQQGTAFAHCRSEDTVIPDSSAPNFGNETFAFNQSGANFEQNNNNNNNNSATKANGSGSGTGASSAANVLMRCVSGSRGGGGGSSGNQQHVGTKQQAQEQDLAGGRQLIPTERKASGIVLVDTPLDGMSVHSPGIFSSTVRPQISFSSSSSDDDC